MTATGIGRARPVGKSVPLIIPMMAIAILAVGFGAMRSADSAITSAVSTATLLIIAVATVGAVVRPAPAAAWRGFAVFGWIYVAVAIGGPIWPRVANVEEDPTDPAPSWLSTQRFLGWCVDRIHPGSLEPVLPSFARPARPTTDGHGRLLVFSTRDPKRSRVDFVRASEAQSRAWSEYRAKYDAYVGAKNFVESRRRASNAIQSGHCCLGLIFALAGSLLGVALSTGHRRQVPDRPSGPGSSNHELDPTDGGYSSP